MGNFPLALRRPGCTLPCEHGPWRTGALRGGRPTSWRPCPHTLSTSRTCIRRLNCSILLDTNVVSLMHCVTRCFGRCLINVGDSWIAGPQPCTQQTTCIARHRTPGNHVATCSTTSSTSVDSGRLQENTISVVYTAGKRARSWALHMLLHQGRRQHDLQGGSFLLFPHPQGGEFLQQRPISLRALQQPV